MHGSVIHQVTTNQRGMYLTSGGIHLFGADVRGPQYAIARSTEDGIYFFGADSSHYLEDVVLRDCKVSSWGRAGISLKYVSDFAVDNCKAQNIAVLGITSSSSKKGKIVHNHVDTVGSGVDTYGIAMTRFNSDSLVTEPRSEDIECAHNLVENVPFWEGIDTHGGKKLSIDNNVIKGCKVGIALVNARNLAGVDTFASLDCSVSRNKIDSLVSDGSKSHGIIMAGVDTAGVGTATEYATGGIIGNIIRGHGDQSSNLSGGIVAYDTLGLVVQGNLIIEPGFAGVTLYHDNKGAEVIGNTVIDPWSSVVTIPQAVAVRAGYNTAQIAYNTLEHDTKTATYLNVHGSRIDSDSTSVIDFGPNNFAIAGTAPYHLSSSAIVTVIEKKSVGADRGNNAATLVPSVDASTQRWATAITADRAVALPTTNAYLGAKFRIVRTAAATGAFNLNVGTGPLKALAPGTWCEVEFDGSAWLLTQYGAL
jgi:hypothetical protein